MDLGNLRFQNWFLVPVCVCRRTFALHCLIDLVLSIGWIEGFIDSFCDKLKWQKVKDVVGD